MTAPPSARYTGRILVGAGSRVHASRPPAGPPLCDQTSRWGFTVTAARDVTCKRCAWLLVWMDRIAT